MPRNSAPQASEGKWVAQNLTSANESMHIKYVSGMLGDETLSTTEIQAQNAFFDASLLSSEGADATDDQKMAIARLDALYHNITDSSTSQEEDVQETDPLLYVLDIP